MPGWAATSGAARRTRWRSPRTSTRAREWSASCAPRSSTPAAAGRGRANPRGAILSLAMLLEHIGHPAAGARVEAAVAHAVRAGETPRDLGGTLSTPACTDAVLRHLEKEPRA